MIDFGKLSARVKEQDKAKEAIRKANYNASMIASVGYGKSKVIIDIASELVNAGKVRSILYTSDNARLRDVDFPAEVEKWHPELAKLIIRECYQTVAKWKDRKFDLHIGDEIDFAITPVYVKGLLNNKFIYKLYVSGTTTKDKEKVINKLAPIVYRISTEEAEDLKIINKTRYYIYNYKMTDEESKKYVRYNSAISQKIADEDQEGLKFTLWNRKRFLGKLNSSALNTRKIINWINAKEKKSRIVVFCDLRVQADRVSKYSYHGKNDKQKDVKNNLDRFQDLEIDEISVVSKIIRGTNLKKADTFIYTSIAGSEIWFEQRNGRGKRLDVDDIARVIFMVPWYKAATENGQVFYKETIMKKWILKASSGLKNIEFKTLKL